jgi:hypothetical protein
LIGCFGAVLLAISSNFYRTAVNAFTTFKLEGDGKILSVFSYGTLSINGGDSVRVIGRYQKMKKVGPYTFSNEIDASRGSVEKL